LTRNICTEGKEGNVTGIIVAYVKKNNMGLSPKEMENAIIKNLPEKTGKSMEEWIELLLNENLSSKKEMNEFLKEKYNVGHFQAQTILKNYEVK